MGLIDHTLRWPRPRRSFGPVCAHATSNVVPAMLSVASTHTEPKFSAIIAATGEKSGLVGRVVGLGRADGPSDESMQSVLVPENQRVESSPVAAEEAIHKGLVVGVA